MMKFNLFLSHFNMILVSIFFVLIFECLSVEGMRPLRDQNQPIDSSFLRYIISKAYSGPSRGGAGH
ncbi:hypothetical protein BVRB_9g223690 [Beta vulgaris subsp. vulgaris]|nr:hypothetical protein BVRB_9g223690 [Beta vulgaris subsp. vulgaris]